MADIRNVVAGDPSPDGKGTLEIARGIEVGHVFQLRTDYSAKMGANSSTRRASAGRWRWAATASASRASWPPRSSRTTTSSGIIWPDPMAPFAVAIIPMGYARSEAVRAAADKLYDELTAAGIDALPRRPRRAPGVLLADQELIGIPHRVVIGERGLKEGMVEYQHRRDAAGHARCRSPRPRRIVERAPRAMRKATASP